MCHGSRSARSAPASPLRAGLLEESHHAEQGASGPCFTPVATGVSPIFRGAVVGDARRIASRYRWVPHSAGPSRSLIARARAFRPKRSLCLAARRPTFVGLLAPPDYSPGDAGASPPARFAGLRRAAALRVRVGAAVAAGFSAAAAFALREVAFFAPPFLPRARVGFVSVAASGAGAASPPSDASAAAPRGLPRGNSKPLRPFSFSTRVAENGRPKREVKSVSRSVLPSARYFSASSRVISRLQTVRGKTKPQLFGAPEAASAARSSRVSSASFSLRSHTNCVGDSTTMQSSSKGQRPSGSGFTSNSGSALLASSFQPAGRTAWVHSSGTISSVPR